MDEIAKKHHATAGWGRVIDGIRQEMVRRKVHAAQTVVLVPYAQLMLEARQAWATALNVRFRSPIRDHDELDAQSGRVCARR